MSKFRLSARLTCLLASGAISLVLAACDGSTTANNYNSVSSQASTSAISIQDKPVGATFEVVTRQLSGTPTHTNISTDSNIVISADHGLARVALAPVAISVAEAVVPVAPAWLTAQAARDPPAYAADEGYTVNTFSANFNPSTVDLANSGKSGFSWYPWNMYDSHTNTAAIGLNADGSVTLAGDTTGPGGELVTATAAHNAAGFVGTAFGGGAYIEAVFRFDPADVAHANSKGWPAFWSLGIEGNVLLGAKQWPGQAHGYTHGIEADFFEYDLLPYSAPTNAYGGTLHDSYGIFNVTCPAFCATHTSVNVRIAPVGTDFTQYHRYGFLWVPATSTAVGYARFYFDEQPMGPDQQWTQLTNQPPTPENQPWEFGIIDRQHLMLILGTGVSEPMTVQSVNVWQSSATQNLHN